MAPIRLPKRFKRPPIQPPVRRIHLKDDDILGKICFGNGSTRASCRLQGGHSKWGQFQEKDAAVLVFCIELIQDQGCQWTDLVLDLSFTETDPKMATTPPTSATTTCPLILEHPSPIHLKGCRDHPWSFHSHWSSNEHGVYTNAKWVWTDPNVEDVSLLYGGVVIQHPGRPFYISGRFQGNGRKSFLRLFYRTTSQLTTFTTLITPARSEESIERKAEGLDQETHNLALASRPGIRGPAIEIKTSNRN